MRGLLVFFAFAAIYFTTQTTEAVKIKIISEPQKVKPETMSEVFTVELQTDEGLKFNAVTTTRVSLLSSSVSGQFYSSPATAPCGSLLENPVLTMALGTARKSFCYSDLNEGVFTINASVPAQPEFLTTSMNIKIFRFLPNPTGSDEGNEWVEIKSSEEKPVLLNGWIIDDKNTGTGPGSSAYILSGSILPGETKKIILPAEAFALNNTGGDEVNLYFSDSSLADQAAYLAEAYDDGIFELVNGVWQPPIRNFSNSGGGGGSSFSGSAPETLQSSNFLQINEIFPNPLGEDQGREWAEVYNPGYATVTLSGYYFADGIKDDFTESAWAVPEGFLIPPMGVLAIDFPKESLILNNSGQERLKLFSPQKKMLDSVIYEDAEENLSWIKNKDNKWSWGIPTRNLPNDQVSEISKIVISEILPRPEGEQEEFVEFYNLTDQNIDLEGMTLTLGGRKKVFHQGTILPGKAYFVVYEDDLPARLSNAGQTLKLFDAFGRLVFEVSYPVAKAGMSYASLDGEKYAWTTQLTPQEPNALVLSATTDEEEKALLEENITNTDKSQSILSRSQAGQLINQVKDLQAKILEMQSVLADLQTQILALSQTDKQNSDLSESYSNLNAGQIQKSRDFRMIIYPGVLILLFGVIYMSLKRVKN